LERLLARLEPWGVRLFCTDDWAPGARPPAAPRADRGDAALPAGRHYMGKDQTRCSESNNARQRSHPSVSRVKLPNDYRSTPEPPPYGRSGATPPRRMLHRRSSQGRG
jgi:hypothetical protein